ncbi:hypothetical protein BDW22DRAFT_1430850 [Trametopsis cervina]|nr:hypothetical protein BDW22DRAFT_1430850 [Trametopsis cervina]
MPHDGNSASASEDIIDWPDSDEEKAGANTATADGSEARGVKRSLKEKLPHESASLKKSANTVKKPKILESFGDVAVAEEQTRQQELKAQMARTELEKLKLQASLQLKQEKRRHKVELQKLRMEQQHQFELERMRLRYAQGHPDTASIFPVPGPSSESLVSTPFDLNSATEFSRSRESSEFGQSSQLYEDITGSGGAGLF